MVRPIECGSVGSAMTGAGASAGVLHGPIDVVAFDADDTLWHSEDSFHAVENQYLELIGRFVPHGVDARAALRATERRHLPISGYGVKAFTLSMIESAIEVTEAAVPAGVVDEVLRLGMGMLTEPVRLLPDVPGVLSDLGADHRLALVTKGDLVHQWRKLELSGLTHHFELIEVVMEKDEPTYQRVIDAVGVEPARFCMVGNSVRSDVLPVLALGGQAVHVAYEFTWDHEVADHDGSVVTAASLAEIPGLIRAAAA